MSVYSDYGPSLTMGGGRFGGVSQAQGQLSQTSESSLLPHQLLSPHGLNGSGMVHPVGSIGGVSMASAMAPIGTVSGLGGQPVLHSASSRGLVPQTMPQPNAMMSSIGIGVETPQSRTLWIGDIGPYIDENFLHSLFAHTGEVTQVKVIRDKNTGLSAGYGFVEFANHFAAKRVLEVLNGQQLPTGDGKVYRLNWASYGINERRADAAGPEYSLFVGDLAPEVNDFILQQTFAERYKSIKSAKVVTDSQTGMSRRYGFVRFFSEEEMHRALVEMQGELCAGRPMRINHATPRRQDNTQAPPGAGQQAFERPEIPESADPNNTTVFIGNLDSSVNEEDLKAHFEPYGELIYVKIPIGKGCGFVQFTHRRSAEAAFEKHGSLIGRQRVRLSWGRSSKKNQTRTVFPGPGAAMRTQMPLHGQATSHYDPLQTGSVLDDGQSVFSAAAFGGFPTQASHQARPPLHGASQLRTEYSASQSPPQQLRQVQSSQLMHQQALQQQQQQQSFHGQQQSQLYYRDHPSSILQQFQRLQLSQPHSQLQQQQPPGSPQQRRHHEDAQHAMQQTAGQHLLNSQGQAPGQHQIQGQQLMHSHQGQQQQQSQGQSQGQSQQQGQTQVNQQGQGQGQQQQPQPQQQQQQPQQQQPQAQSQQQPQQQAQGHQSQSTQQPGASQARQGMQQMQQPGQMQQRAPLHQGAPSQQQLYAQYGAFQEQGFDHGFDQGYDQGYDQLGSSSPMGHHRTASGQPQFSSGPYGSGSFGGFQSHQDYVGDGFTDTGFSRQEQHSVSSFLFDDDEVVAPFMAHFSASKDPAAPTPSDGQAVPGSGSPPSAVGTIGSPSRTARSSANAGEGGADAAQMPLYGGQYLSTHVY